MLNRVCPWTVEPLACISGELWPLRCQKFLARTLLCTIYNRLSISDNTTTRIPEIETFNPLLLSFTTVLIARDIRLFTTDEKGTRVRQREEIDAVLKHLCLMKSYRKAEKFDWGHLKHNTNNVHGFVNIFITWIFSIAPNIHIFIQAFARVQPLKS